MTQEVIADPASIQRQALLLAAFEASAAEWQDRADRYRQIGAPSCRIETALTIAYDAKCAAERIRMRLVALSGLTEGDVAVSGPVAIQQAPTMGQVTEDEVCPLDSCRGWSEQVPPAVCPWKHPWRRLGPPAEACQTPDEPPEQLAALSDWLRRRLGPVFVWVTASRWQEIAWLLLASRPGGVR